MQNSLHTKTMDGLEAVLREMTNRVERIGLCRGGRRACVLRSHQSKGASMSINKKAAPVQDWDEIEALRESLREHMAEIHRLRAALADHVGGANKMVTTKPVNLLHTMWRPEVVAALRASMAEGHAAQVVYQISLKNGPASSAWIDVDEAAYNSAKLYGEYKCRCLYTAPPQRKPLTDEEIHDCFQQSGKTKAETRRRITRAIERAHGIGASNE